MRLYIRWLDWRWLVFKVVVNLKQSKSDEQIREKRSHTPITKSLLRESVLHPNPHHEPFRFSPHNVKHRADGLSKIWSWGDHYCVGCLGQTRLLLSESLISDHRQFRQSWRTEHMPCRSRQLRLTAPTLWEDIANSVHIQRLVYLTAPTLWEDITNNVHTETGLSGQHQRFVRT